MCIKLKISILGIFLTALTSCASVQTTFANEPSQKIYSGTKSNTKTINTTPNCGSNMGSMGHMFDKPIAYIDFIPSLLLDTVLLIYTVPHDLIQAQAETQKPD